MNHKLAFSVGTISGAVCVGLIGGLFASPGLALLGLVALNGSFMALSGESKEDQLLKELNEVRTKLTFAQSKNEIVDSKLADAFKLLENFKVTLAKSEKDKCEAVELIQDLQNKSKNLHEQLVLAQDNYSAALEQIEELENDLNDWRNGFREKLEKDTDKLFRQKVNKIVDSNWSTHDAITSEAMQLLSEYQSAASQMRERFEAKNQEFQEVKQFYAKNLKEFNTLFTNERDAYLNEIDLLRGRIAQLQQEIAGDLVEPVYGNFGYQLDARIADDIARQLWHTEQIPLAVKGFKTYPDGSAEAAYSYSKSQPLESILKSIQNVSVDITKSLGINKIISVKKYDLSDLILISWRREALLKEDNAKLLAGSAEEFIKYVVSHPIRYRLIADPGQGKTPTTALMLSAILKEGCRQGNVPRGKKVPHTLVTVSYPDVQSSLKDYDYPLERFLKYGNSTAAVKSFDDAIKDWEYRKQNLIYAKEFFQIRVWDELDNTVNSADNPMAISEKLKTILKQGGHSNIGWIVSGQSVMTSQILGFKDDDRSLFTEIIIGIPKIRMYCKKYAKGKNSDANLTKLEKNLDDLEAYMESANNKITDTARELRLALIIDEKSPKLYFLPNLDDVYFDEVSISESEQKARDIINGTLSGNCAAHSVLESSNTDVVKDAINLPFLPKPTIGGTATCPHCGGIDLSLHKGERYYCKSCKKKSAASKVVFR